LGSVLRHRFGGAGARCDCPNDLCAYGMVPDACIALSFSMEESLLKR
jgi:hypothetical protein